MSAGRAAATVGGMALMAAWLASAAGVIRGPRESVTSWADTTATTGAETLAADVQAQAARLRERLSHAPVPHPAARNPFRFQPRAVSQRPVARAAAIIEPPPSPVAPPPPPPLKLEGLAEREISGARKRIAILSRFGEIYLVPEGDTVEGRYRVVAIGADAVELEDVSTGATTRLAIR
jgi:hypothetical protein